MKKLINIFIFLFYLLPASALTQIEEHLGVVVTPDADKYEVSDSDFYRIAKQVIFPVNKYTIPADSKFRDELVNEIMPYVNKHGLQLQKIIMRGAASPEGPYDFNAKLSKNRAQAVLDLVDKYADIPSEVTTTKNVPEDYTYLLQLMKEAHDADYNRVKAVVDKYLDKDQKRLKRELQLLNHGKIWRRMYKAYFPKLRTARFILVFSQPKKPVVEQVKEPVNNDTVPKVLPAPIVEEPEVDSILPRREILSVKTNLLFDFAYMPGYDRFCPIPNIALEYYPLHGHFTFGASFDCPWWQNYDAHKYFQVRNYQVETRYYLRSGDVKKRGYGNGAAFKGLYFQAYAHAGLYSIMFDANRGWEGEGFGGGLGIGYVLPLTKKGHWRLEFGVQVGYFWTQYDPYQYECPVDPNENDNLYYYKWTLASDLFKKRQYRFTWMGPTRVGITLTYDLLYRKRAKKGISFRSWEKFR